MKIKKQKQSMIMGALTGSVGIFLTKLIGLIYMIPFDALIQDNGVYYTYAYRIYGYLLNVTTAGFPFAIAALVAKYMVKEDYDMVVAIRKLSFIVMSVFGGACMIGVILFATPIAAMITNVSPEAIATTAKVLRIISLALFIVPLLGVYRGFYQGLKELNLYAANQVLEQLIRVAFLLIAGYTAVYLFKMDRIFAVYFAVLSTGVSAIAAVLHIKTRDVTLYKEYKEKSRPLTKERSKQLLSELFRYAMPFMVVAVLGNSYYVIDLFSFEKAMALHGVEASVSSTIYSIINLQVDKLTSIPMVIAPGFSLAIIPYITSSYIKGDWKTVSNNITDALSAALFFVLPLSFVLMSLGSPIYHTLYSNYQTLGGEILSWYSLDGLTSAIAPVVTALMMALNLRALNIRNILFGVLVKLVTVIPLIFFFGYPGALLSSVLGTLTSIVLNLRSIHQLTPIRFQKLLVLSSKIFLCLCTTQVVFMITSFIGLRVVDQSRFWSFIELGIVGILGAVAYFATAIYLHLPQAIFHKSTAQLKAMLRLGGRS